VLSVIDISDHACMPCQLLFDVCYGRQPVDGAGWRLTFYFVGAVYVTLDWKVFAIQSIDSAYPSKRKNTVTRLTNKSTCSVVHSKTLTARLAVRPDMT